MTVMSSPDYQEGIKKFVVYEPNCTYPYLTYGLVAEAGELAGKIAKDYRGDYVITDEDVLQELGDIQFFVTMLCSYYNISLEQLFRLNYDKLNSRFNRGTIRGDGDAR